MKLIQKRFAVVTIDEMIEQRPYWNGHGDGTANEIIYKPKEIDFSNMSDEDWLKLKNVKKIIFETIR